MISFIFSYVGVSVFPQCNAQLCLNAFPEDSCKMYTVLMCQAGAEKMLYCAVADVAS